MNESYLITRSRIGARYLLCVLCLATFGGCSSKGYQREQGKWVYVWFGADGRQVRHLDDADGQLEILSDVNYAATSEHVYLWGVMIPHADPARFQLLTYPYSSDSKRVYCGTIPMRDANPASFRVLGGQLDPDYVSRAEAYEIWVGPITTVSSDSAIIGALGWSTDGDTVFFGPNPIMGARPQSFRLLNDHYATDGASVFFGREKLERADPETFRVINFTKAEDRNYTYEGSDATKRSDLTQNGQE